MYCNKKNHEQVTPLIGSYNEDAIIAWLDGQPVMYGDFLADILHVASRLPNKKYIFNLCEDRYLFLVTFAAIIVNGQTNLLPPNKKSNEIADIARDYADCCYVSETAYDNLDIDKAIIKLPLQHAVDRVEQIPSIDKQHPAVVIFTSGSTGQARGNLKTWHELVEGIRHFQTNLGIGDGHDYSVVATVPPQHMYGLETSILLPLVGGVRVSSQRPFYPEDILNVLHVMPRPVILITTPLQLKACAYSGLDWPEIELVVCSTAPLSVELAIESEQAMHTRVMEIYGSTETGAIAGRRTALEEQWSLFSDYRIDPQRNVFIAKHMAEPIELNDHVLMLSENTFKLMGRKSDLIKIAGKRGSIGDLNNKLKSIEGVKDGVFIYPDDSMGLTSRLIVLVVAPDTTEATILEKLAELIDPAFLPRPLVKVDCLPYTEVNKLRRYDLLDLYKQVRK